ncbi:cytochrome P450 [Actinoplanes sp. NBRC 103695]|uniref:cytochrome P450 n=1 Tax=Actinoplanes sp. NBRC 103695 TaxID=3032202 RepID=UPI0024A1BEED|nr:cytochrome P450 [Actinoplanes sp. NBRC 103695]GLZ02453.1 cytochrome P450 [Actinoplanes sp. NBRC 103695]
MLHTLSGPRPLPLLGNLLGLVRGGAPHRVLERWADEYGPTFRIRLGPRPVVVTGDQQHVDFILRQRPQAFRRSRSTAEVFEELVPHSVFTAEGERWSRLRKVVTQSLRASYLQQYFATITTATERLLRGWHGFAASGAPIDVLDQMTRYTLDVVAELSLGHDLNSLEDRGDGLHRRLPMLMSALTRRLLTPIPYWRYVKLPQDRRLDATVRELRAVVRTNFDRARARMNAGGEPSNFLEALVIPLADEPSITDDEVFGNVLTMLLAGEDTTSSSAAWALHFLAEYPEVHARVRAEADEVLGDRRLPGDVATVGRLSYAEAVVKEALRLKPVVPFLSFHPIRSVMLTGGDGRELHLDDDTEVMLLPSYGARRDVERFPEPDEFRPQRWLEGRLPAEALPFAPFGGGPRFCPGRNLAMIEAAMVTSAVARTFDLAPDRSAGPVTEGLSFAMVPRGLHLIARDR